MSLIVAPCSYEASKHAVLNWHYSAAMPATKNVMYGVWESGRFTGAVLFGRGASPYLGSSLGLDQTEVCELTRVALRSHAAPVTQIVASALKQLRASSPGLRAVVSFADPKEGHRGGIYQAGNWIYTGKSNEVTEYYIDGRWQHTRNAHHNPKRPRAPKRTSPGKFRYIYPFDRAMRRQVQALSLPYPSADEGSTVSHDVSYVEGQVRLLPSAPKAGRDDG